MMYSLRPLTRRLFLAMLAALLPAIIEHAQAQPTIDPRTAGNLYMIAFPDTTSNLYDLRQDAQTGLSARTPVQDTMSLTMYSAVDNSIEITGYGGYSKKLAMKGGEITTVYLNGTPRASAPIVAESGVISDKTFRVTAANPVVVYCFVDTKFGIEAFTPLPVDGWGQEYYAAALPGEVLYDVKPATTTNYGKLPKAGPAEILVMAAFDNTHVTIVPNARLDRNPLTSVLLKAGQCYQVQSFVDTNVFNLGNPQPDLGGSYIFADKPIGVITGNTRSQLIDIGGGLARNSFKNLMIEWLTPVEEHGTHFVYTPTWDLWRPTGAPGEDPAGKRQGEVVRVYATAGSVDDQPPAVTNVDDVDGVSGNVLRTSKVDRTKFYETLIGAANPHVFTTDKPAQAFMNSTAVVKFDGTTGGVTSYSGEGAFMVGLTPVEQWSYVAPYVTPIDTGMTHYLNIVTDSTSRNKITINGQPLLINRWIAGTRYYWGTRTLNKGEKGLIQGADATVKFYAAIYGEAIGHERFYTAESAFPGVYEENIGRMYGYPVAAAHNVLKPADTLQIDSIKTPCRLTVKVRTLNANPAGLRSITLDSAVNAQLTFVDPVPPQPVTGATKAEVTVTPIDPRKDASGIVVIQDRTGRSWKVYYKHISLYLKTIPSSIVDFGQVTINTKVRKTVTVINSSDTPISLDTLMILLGTGGFAIVDTKPPLSHDPNNRTLLGPGDSLLVTIELNPVIQNKNYEDTLFLGQECGALKLPLRGETDQPCLDVNDIDFGVISLGEEVSREMRICNKGRGQITFQNPFLGWLRSEFNVTNGDVGKLQAATLGPNDCVTITVTFMATSVGSFVDVGHFFASAGGAADGCKDSSRWAAVVTGPSSVDRSDAAATSLACEVEPNPLSTTAQITINLGAAERTSVEIFDAAGVRVASLADEILEAGPHAFRWDAGDLPSGIYYCRIHAGTQSIMRPVLLVR